MNKFQAALFHARPIVEHGPAHHNYICLALKQVGCDHKNLASACMQIRQNIELDLIPNNTLWSYLGTHYQYINDDQLTLARLAWIDRLMERYK